MDPAFCIDAPTIFMGPSQAKLSGPASTIGSFTILRIKSSEAGVKQGLSPVASRVRVTEPLVISFRPGI